MSTEIKGQLALLKAEECAVGKGWITSRPTMQAAYDLILDDRSRLYRAQVKYADGKSQKSSGSVVARLEHRTNGSKLRHDPYTEEQIDAVLVYLPKIDQVLWLGPEIFTKRKVVSIRIEPPKNNQVTGVMFAEDFIW